MLTLLVLVLVLNYLTKASLLLLLVSMAMLWVSEVNVQLVLVVAGALDDVGTERNSYGGYLQGTYDFGQGTSAGYSYGGNCLRRTGNDIQTRGVMNCQTMHSGMIWHNVTDNFRLVAEGGYTEKTWYLADSDQEDSFGGVGAFFFW